MNTMKKCSTCQTMFSGDLCPKCMAGFVQKPSEPAAAPEDLPLKPGQTFHGLEILELLGRGGMGVVFKAKQPALDRLVALKILPQKMALDPDFQNRFIREAKALGALSHPNIVAVYDFGAESGLFFFVMEFVDGVNLRQVLRERKLTPEQGLKIIPQLCDALEYAHTEGVVHRDIKPENIMIDRKGRVKIADFGLAKLTGADQPALLTMTNMVMGTPHYMAPEQVENPKQVDHRADIYSMGVVFYEMLTGELPIGRFEPPSKKVHVDVRLDDIVLKALEKEPERRYQKASEVKDAVSRATSVTSVESYMPTVVTPKPEKRKRVWTLAAVAILLVAAAVAVAAFTLVPPRPGPAAPPVAAPAVPVPAGPLDLTPLHFGPDERPGGIRFQGTGQGLPRNPLPAKDAPELDVLIANLDGIGLQNVDRSDIKQGYLAAWYAWYAAFVALETPIADRLEREFHGLSRIRNRWSHRKGNLLVLAWSPRRDQRTLLADLVGRLQKKLGLPEQPPEVPLENLELEKSDLPSGYVLAEVPRDVEKGARGARFRAENTQKASAIEMAVLQFDSPERAAAREAELLRERCPGGAPWKDVIRSGRLVVALALSGEDFSGYVKLRGEVRQWMGYEEKTFDTIVLTDSEIPKGFTLDRSERDVRTIHKDLGIAKVRPADIRHAWRATFKPHGAITLLELTEYRHRSEAEADLRTRGPTETGDNWVFGVEGPDDETLDALENRMREKFGFDRNRPRPIDLSHARLKEADLPAGLTLGPAKADRVSFVAQIGGQGFTLTFTVREGNDLKQLTAFRKAPEVKPGHILLGKDYVVAHVAGPEEAWGALDTLEPVLRRKMRLGPPTATDYRLEPHELPTGRLYLERRDLGFDPNPNPFPERARLSAVLRDRLAADVSDVVAAWAAVIDPDETQVFVLEAQDVPRAKDLAERLRKNVKAKHVAVYEKAPIVAVVRSDRQLDEEFRAVAELVRAKLRARPP
jgi:predicted Ser/Thr protein kinase